MANGVLEFSRSILRLIAYSMSDETSYISQIQQEEASAAKMLEQVEEENNKRLVLAAEEADSMVQKAEEEEREVGGGVIFKAKEEAKAAYGRLLTDASNSRRDVIEAGKTKISVGKKKVVDAFMAMFE